MAKQNKGSKPKKDTRSHHVRRTLINLNSGSSEKIVVTLNMPQKDNNDWYCQFEIRGDRRRSGKVYGIDSFQSLVLCLDVIRKYLENNYKNLQWEGGEFGDHGFPLIVPSFLNKDVITKIEKSVSVELSNLHH